MSVFDEEITIEKLNELGFKSASTTQYENITEFDILYKTIKCVDLYGLEVTIYYFTNKNEENVETIFKGAYSSTHFYDTVKDVIEMTTLIHRAEEMLKEEINYHFQFSAMNKRIDLT